MVQSDDSQPIRRALLSVSDKTGIVDLAGFLVKQGVEILSTGGTASLLRKQGIAVVDVSTYTGFPEMMGGRFKTLHPRIYGGLLGRGEMDRSEMDEHAIKTIDLLVVNLYPFEQTAAKKGATVEQCIENIDIGGVAMIRAAAKNHSRVAVVVGHEDYDLVASKMNDNGGRIPRESRLKLATKAFRRTSEYDAAILQWMHRIDCDDADAEQWPQQSKISLNLVSGLRYGENPHQRGAFYATGKNGLAAARQLQGKMMSYNNFIDASSAYECVFHFEETACVIIKHATPCGVACGERLAQAYQQAVAADPVSAFGGIIAFNRELDVETAKLIVDGQFVELVVAPAIDPAALDILSRKSALRVLDCPAPKADALRYRSVLGGILVQESDAARLAVKDLKIVTERAPDQDELEDLLFAWRVVKFVKSNAIVFARDKTTTGIGAGQTSRVDSVRIAARKAQAMSSGKMSMASDAFFPFRDGIDLAAQAGISAIIQPGGSIHDDTIVAAANQHNIAMVLTGIRHFLH